MSDEVCVLICAGKSCRKSKGFDELRRSFEDLATVKTVKCVDVCDGPVAGLPMKGKTVWLERLGSNKVREALMAALSKNKAKSKLPKKLRAHQV
jgi:hypothetical protein